MSFTGTYNKTNLSATAYNAFLIADTSDYTDEPKDTFSGRRIWLVRDDGTYVSPVSQVIITNGVDATATFETQSVPAEGTIVGFAINDPVDGFIYMPTYTVVAGDYGNTTIFNANWEAALNTNIYGYVFDASADIITVTARAGLGTDINGTSIAPSNVNGNITNFAGGTDGTSETVTGLDYWDFSYTLFPDDEITINALEDEDAALNIYVEWLSEDEQSGSTYTASGVFDFKDNAEDFMYNKVLQLAAYRQLWSNKNFRTTLNAARTMIDSSTTSVVYQDQYASQVCINFVGEIENNPNLFY